MENKLVKDLTVKEFKEMLRQVVRDEIRFQNVTECKGFPIEPIKFPKKFEITWAEADGTVWRKDNK